MRVNLLIPAAAVALVVIVGTLIASGTASAESWSGEPPSLSSNTTAQQTESEDSGIWPDTAEGWVKFVGEAVGIVAILGAASRFLLPGPFVGNWESDAPKCSIRRLPTKKFVYVVELTITNHTNVVCELQSADVDLEEDSDKTPTDADWTHLKLFLRRVSAGNKATISWSSVPLDQPLSGAVFLHWKMRYRRRRGVGLWLFFWKEEEYNGNRAISVDTQSLQLYGIGTTDDGSEG